MNYLIKYIKEFYKNHQVVCLAGCGGLVAAVVLIVVLCCSGSDDTLVVPEEPTPVVATPIPTPTLIPTPTPEPTPTQVPTPTPDPTHPGEVRSVLDGLWIPEEVALKRPYAIMFNNLAPANPQSGIGDCKILYEALAEAGITRLMGVYEGLTDESSCKDRIGSVRSARHYFASFADEYDAIFVHFGETTYATKKIKNLKLDHLEGTYGIGDTVFYRDKEIKAPHNAFASLEGIHKGIEKLGLREDHPEGYKPNHFEFNLETVAIEEGTDAALVKLPYSSYMSPYFVYDAATDLYTRYQFDDVHIDRNTSTPLTFTNIIIQIVDEFDKDENGYQDMKIKDATGNGYYITGGKCVPITWSKKEADRFMMYYDAQGEVLKINPGRTFISVFPDYRESKIEIN